MLAGIGTCTYGADHRSCAQCPGRGKRPILLSAASTVYFINFHNSGLRSKVAWIWMKLFGNCINLKSDSLIDFIWYIDRPVSAICSTIVIDFLACFSVYYRLFRISLVSTYWRFRLQIKLFFPQFYFSMFQWILHRIFLIHFLLY